MEMSKQYAFGDTVLRIEGPRLPLEDSRLGEFAVGEDRLPHHTFRILPADGRPFPPGQRYHFQEREGDVTRVFMGDMEVMKDYALSLFLANVKAYDLLPERGGVILHASFVVKDGKALLFSAPSGTGKSTQAHFWETERGWEIVNEDRVLLQLRDGVPYACGCWAMGSAGVTRNVTLPVEALVLLSQGTENVATTLRPSEVLRRLIPQCAYSAKDPACREWVIGLLCELIPVTAVLSYACINHPSSVEYLERYLWKTS